MASTKTSSTSARDRILHAAERTILARGYPGTTVDEICDAADVSKGSFYHHFDSKEALGLAVLEAYYGRGIARLMQGPFMAETDPVRRCLGLLDHAESIGEEVWADGCILGTYAVDLAETSPRIHRAVSKRLTGLVDALTPLFRDALAEAPGRGRKAIRPQELAEQFLAAVEGSIVLSKAHGDVSRITHGIRTLRVMLEGYLTR
jgi:TetR/AcrR family transcriptional repressor of nem operon